MSTRSLTSRVLWITSVWIAIALTVIALVISHLYRQGTEASFTDLLRAQLYNVINSVSVGKDGKLEGRPELGDLRFVQPETGWYWTVTPLGDFKAPPIRSISLGQGNVPVESQEKRPFNSRYERFYRTNDSFGNAVEVAETEVLLDNEGHAARFRVIGNHKEIEHEIDAFDRQVFLVFLLFGLGSLAVNALAVLFGLRPLDAVRRRLEDIRSGKSESLTGVFPREIAPLVSEVNALIDNNRRIVDRARTQVGNLAHSLKTPIAVLYNEARRLDEGPRQLVSAQVATMQTQVQSYLDRARIAAQSATVLARTEPAPVIERLMRVMRRLHPDLRFDVEDGAGTGHLLAMEQQDLEEVVGNLLDNAAKFAGSAVRVVVEPSIREDDPGRRSWLSITVEDDGAGLDEAEIDEALKRGRRLDESKPGTGLGLSIVSEIVAEYQGALKLRRGNNGGLEAMLVLPQVDRTT
ncbi:ATP-binding protein [Pararhizobium mangrovi]|uniref:histidine kinase n=1 Tax=Pararhizobium mangrovi TaxID=2590452 RepID=A0A506UHI2_9HYPH|nr:HAMP domain-containing sensor histidine kinase [Pararhizobium mangrovi]TPW32770.1 HAMP domain-containing histidine kinase [Pararhizobium mangrovi]